MAYLSKHEFHQSLDDIRKTGPRTLLDDYWRRHGSNVACMPSTRELAAKFHRSQRTIKRWKAELRRLGKITSTRTMILYRGLHRWARCVVSLVKPADQKPQKTANVIEVATKGVTLPQDGDKNGPSITRQYIKSGLDDNSEVVLVDGMGQRWSSDGLKRYHEATGRLPRGIHLHQLR